MSIRRYLFDYKFGESVNSLIFINYFFKNFNVSINTTAGFTLIFQQMIKNEILKVGAFGGRYEGEEIAINLKKARALKAVVLNKSYNGTTEDEFIVCLKPIVDFVSENITKLERIIDKCDLDRFVEFEEFVNEYVKNMPEDKLQAINEKFKPSSYIESAEEFAARSIVNRESD